MARPTPLYRAWENMMARCYGGKHIPGWHRYGGRGIRVCKRWHSPANFMKDMGPKPQGLSLERKNLDGHYTPRNCVWASWHTQARNTSRNVNVTLNGDTRCLLDWCVKLSVRYNSVVTRIRRGWSPKTALTTPIGRRATNVPTGFVR